MIGIKTGKIKINNDFNYKMFAFVLFWGMIQEIVFLFLLIFNIYDESYFALFCKVVIFLVLVYISWILIFNKIRIDLFVICTSWIVLFVFSILKYYKVLGKYVSDFGGLLVFSFLAIILLMNKLDDIDKIEKSLQPYMNLMVIYSLLCAYYFSMHGHYSMNFSYHAVIPAVLSLLFAISYHKYMYLFHFFLYCIINLYAGARGSFICIVAASVLAIFVYAKNTNVKIGVLCLSIIIGIILIFQTQILDFLLKIMGYSRTLELIRSGQLLRMSGRDLIYKSVKDGIQGHLFSIRGFYADRILVSASRNTSFNPGLHAHNIIYEFTYDFGFLGIIALITILILTIKCYIIIRDNDNRSLKNLFITSVAYAYGQLFVSSSFLIAPSFGLLISMILYILNYEKNIKERSQGGHVKKIVWRNIRQVSR